MEHTLKTIKYLLCLRESLATIFPKQSNELINEFTDYEILYLTKYGKRPRYKFNFLEESLLVEDLKVFLLNNIDFLEETVGLHESHILIDSLQPLGKSGLTSSKVLLEGMIKSGTFSILTEQSKQHQYTWKEDPETGDKLLVDMTENRIVKRVPANTSTKELKKIMDGVSKISLISSTAAQVRDLGRSVSSGVKAAGEIAGNAGKAILQGAKKVGTSAAAVGKFAVSKIGTANLGYAALAAALMYGGYKLYKSKFSQSVRACSKYTGEEKIKCKKKIQADAIRSQIYDLKVSMIACNKTASPNNCKLIITNKITKLQKKLTDLSV